MNIYTKINFALIITALALTACVPRQASPTQTQTPTAPPSQEVMPDPLTEHNLDQALEAINVLEELGIE